MTPPSRVPGDAHALEREAAGLLAEALRKVGLPGGRESHRSLIVQAIELARAALAKADATPEAIACARGTLVRSLAARAADARYGAGQLSMSAQRAPTREACDDGWRRVDAIVAGAEAAARQAMELASRLDDSAVWEAAHAAETAAREARRIVDQRNDAYTFHADPGFSFGEGWYLGAAAVLAGVAIQIEPGQPQTYQAERFLVDAGLGDRLVPPRTRPRANKQLPAIVAQAFRADPASAQRRLRAAFLVDGPIPQRIVDWADRSLAAASTGGKVLLWVRRSSYQASRNSAEPELHTLGERVRAAGLAPVLVGDALDGPAPVDSMDLTLFWKEPLFQGSDMRLAQLQFFEYLRRAHGLFGQMGVTTAGMDGPALMGLPTLYLTDAPNDRLGKWVGVVPGYRELVREEGYLERVGDVLNEWARRAEAG